VQSITTLLRQRGLLEAVTDEGVHAAVMAPLTVYAGFDPSAASLQVGNLATVVSLARFQRCGHKVIALVGGATGLIGDPSGKVTEREALSLEQVERNSAGIRENLSRFLDFDAAGARAELVNNIEWLGRFTLIAFLGEVGRHFRMGAMLAKDSVRARLESEGGMSFAEFCYQLLQAYDFLNLFDRKGCTLQVGGSDQWGNITAGVDLIRRLRGAAAFGLTFPLICDSAGRKFGKSEGNAVYLDHRLTPYFDFYQFFLRAEDADVARLLNVFTFLSAEEIAALEREVRDAPEKREAQKVLAAEVTRMVHGRHGLDVALRASAALFGAAMEGLRADDLLDVFAHVPSAELPAARVRGMPAADVAAAAGLCRSKGEARRLIESGGLYVNNVRVTAADAVIRPEQIVDGRVLVLRSGKRSFHLVRTI